MHSYTYEPTQKELVIPNETMKQGGFEKGEPVQISVTDSVIILTKPRMKAIDIVHAIDGLYEVTTKLVTHLAEICGFCEGCGDGCGGVCPVEPQYTATAIPLELRKELGIPLNAKLCASPGEEPGTAIVERADHRYDLSDVPEWERELLRSMGACLAELDNLLMSEDLIYG